MPWRWNPQHRYVPLLGIEPKIFWCTGQCSNQLSHLLRALLSSYHPFLTSEGLLCPGIYSVTHLSPTIKIKETEEQNWQVLSHSALPYRVRRCLQIVTANINRLSCSGFFRIKPIKTNARYKQVMPAALECPSWMFTLLGTTADNIARYINLLQDGT